MPQEFATTAVGALVTERPSRARVFERFGIDYCCGGKKPLSEACERTGVRLEEVLDEIERSDARATSSAPETDWASSSLTDLADHIEQTHHAYLAAELPRLSALLEKVDRAHGDRRPELREVRKAYERFRAELEHHTAKEERMLFPAIRTLESTGGLPERFPFRSVRNPIAIMNDEHDHAGDGLRHMRELTGGFTPAPTDCNTLRAALDGLAELERDTHTHVHKENHILFPRSIELEASLIG